MAKKTDRKKFLSQRNQFVLGAIAIVVMLTAVGLYAAWQQYGRFKATRDASDAISVRSLIINAAENTKAPAPIDAKTGDAYFPQAKLYLPNPDPMAQFTYAYDKDAKELSVSSRTVFGQAAAPLYAAANVSELFSGIPKLQACQRGVKLTYQKRDNKDNPERLHASIKPGNGKTLYIYTEKACPELDAEAIQLRQLQSY